METELTLRELRRRPHWSAASLNELLNICSLKWAFTRLYRLEPEFTPVPLPFGLAFHNACDYYALARKQNAPVTAEAVVENFSQAWSAQIEDARAPVRFPQGQTADDLCALGQRMVRAWFDAQSPEEEIVAVAYPFAVTLRRANGTFIETPLIGELDLVVRQQQSYTIVDWKTAARKWPEGKADKELQPTCYLLAVQEVMPWQAFGFRYDVVTKTKQPTVSSIQTTRSQSDFDRLACLVDIADRMVAQELFYPADQSFFCNGCAHRSACKQWHRRQAATHDVAA